MAQNNEVYRINSVTKTVDNYTSRFSSYSNFKFVDIAGQNENTVFIATNSSNVIQYNNGTIKLIGASDGISGIANSVGITDSPLSYVTTYFPKSLDILVIGTDKGLYRYSINDGTVTATFSDRKAVIYDATYRSIFHTYNRLSYNNADSVQYKSMLGNGYNAVYIWMGGNQFGNVVNTVTETTCLIYNYINLVEYQMLFYGTENGMFQIAANHSLAASPANKRYLYGTKVNKITTLYGLTSFGNGGQFFDPGLIKENLLIGTDKGLYFSNSIYSNYGKLYDKDKISIFSFIPLANVIINDINVNVASDNNPICEDGLWVAAVNGLYLLKPDYGAYLNTSAPLKDIQFEGHGQDVTKLELCANTTIKAIQNGYTGNTQQWYKDGNELPNQSGSSLTIKDPGDYYALLYDPCSSLHLQSNHLTVTQVAAPVFIFNYPDVINYCAGTSAHLKTDDKPNYQYRWYKDGILNDNTTAALDNITETGKYNVEVSACAGNWVPSKEVQVNFITVPKPNVLADKTSYCDGDLATLSATVPIDVSQIINWTAYQYKWYKDGAPISGTGSSIKVNQTGRYNEEVTGCSGPVLSYEVQVIFDKPVQPVLVADKVAYCIGDNAKLSINTSIDPLYTITWFRDGNLLRTELGKTSITTNLPGNYTVNITNSTTTCKILSTAYALSFTPPPTVSIQQIVNTTLCDGQTVDLKASYSSGNIRWTTGATTDKISVKNSGTYKATVATVAGCEVTESTTVQFLPNPSLNVPSATLCQFTKESITLTAPDGFVKYEWNGQAGNSTFSTDKLGSVNLTVTDNNGCKATQTINISSHCDDIHIPNTFSPNGDGHNDSWVIAGLEGDLSTTVKVYNRLGSLVFQSKSYASPWNGTFNGKKLPAAVYYYVISTQEAKQVLSGWVTILY